MKFWEGQPPIICPTPVAVNYNTDWLMCCGLQQVSPNRDRPFEIIDLVGTDVGQKFAPPNQQSREECIAFVKDEWGAGGGKTNQTCLNPF